jgi:branched-chain amino acid transport system substrate-binding protein
VALACGAACGDSAEQQGFKGTIQVRGLFDLSGPTRADGTPYQVGLLDALEYANAHGGVAGYEVEIVWQDYAYAPATAVATYEGWKQDPSWSDVVTVFGWGTADSVALSSQVAQDRIPYISASYAGTLGSPAPVMRSIPLPDGTVHQVNNPGAPYNFYAGTDYSTSIRLAAEFIKRRGGSQVLFAYCSAGYCTDPIPAGKSHADSLGLDIAADILDDALAAGKQRLELSDPESEIERKIVEYFAQPGSADVDWVWVGNSSTTANYIVRALAEHAPEVKVISNVFGFDETTFANCGQACVGRMFGVLPFAAYGDTRFQGMETVVEVHDQARQRAGEELSAHTSVRYVQGHVSFTLWQLAIEKLAASGSDITGPEIRAAIESFSGLDLGGLTLPLTFSASDHRPADGARIYSINESGKLEYQDEVRLELQASWLGW